MTEHPRELLLLIASGRMPDAETSAHLASCATCTATLNALSEVDLDYSWRAVETELDAPKRSWIERLLAGFGVSPGAARFAALTPTLRPAWVLASIVVLVLAAAVTQSVDSALPPILLAAPLLAAGTVAFAYGPGADRAYEVTSATPLSPVTGLLIRLTAVLVADSALVGIVDAIAGSRTLMWFLPMAAIAGLSAVVAARTQPLIGAATGMVVWSFVVAAITSTSRDPQSVLLHPTTQAVYLLTFLVSLSVLLLWAHAGRLTVKTR